MTDPRIRVQIARQSVRRQVHLAAIAAYERLWPRYRRWAPRGSERWRRTGGYMRILAAYCYNQLFRDSKRRLRCVACGSLVDLRKARRREYDVCPSCDAMYRYFVDEQERQLRRVGMTVSRGMHGVNSPREWGRP